MRLELPGPGTYIAVEIKAPQGYGPSPDEYQFTITGNEGNSKRNSDSGITRCQKRLV